MTKPLPTAVITGGCSGIGLATARVLIAEGYRVVSLDMHAPAEEVAGLEYVQTDITKARDVERAAATVGGPVRVLFNNAGLMRRGTMLESSEEDFDVLFGVHLKGSWLVTKALLPLLEEDATVVQMASAHALKSSVDPGLYTLSKQAAEHFADLLQKTYPRLKVKTVFPWRIDTPLSRYGVQGEALAEKLKTMDTTEHMAQSIAKLIASPFGRLVYDDHRNEHVLE